MERIYINDDHYKFIKRETSHVDVISEDGSVLENLEPHRLFPVSSEDKFITLLDSENRERAIIKDLSVLSSESRAVVEECLREFYLIPKIQKVLDRTEKYGVLKWTVLTDRGEVTFAINNRNSDIKIFFNGRVLVRDTNDNRYEIDNWEALDRKSRQLLGYDL